MKKIIVLHVSVEQEPQIVTIDGSLESMQALVGGWLEHVQLDDGLDLYCNEEGRLRNLPLNLRRENPIGNTLNGDFFLCRSDQDGEAISLTPQDIKFLQQRFALPD